MHPAAAQHKVGERFQHQAAETLRNLQLRADHPVGPAGIDTSHSFPAGSTCAVGPKRLSQVAAQSHMGPNAAPKVRRSRAGTVRVVVGA